MMDPNSFVELGINISKTYSYREPKEYCDTWKQEMNSQKKLVKMDSSMWGNIVRKTQRKIEFIPWTKVTTS